MVLLEGIICNVQDVLVHEKGVATDLTFGLVVAGCWLLFLHYIQILAHLLVSFGIERTYFILASDVERCSCDG